MKPFIIYALPRSRTAWLSKFLTYGDWTCHHEMAGYIHKVEDIKHFFACPNIGTAETGAILGWRLIKHYAPTIRTVVIRRPVEDVVQAMLAIDMAGLAKFDEHKLRVAMLRADRALQDISRYCDDALTVDYAALDERFACRKVFIHCLGERMPLEWYERWKDENVQVNVPAAWINYQKNREKIDQFKRECYRDLRRLAKAGEL